MRFRFARLFLVPPLLLVGLVAFPACDSSDPDPPAQAEEVVGIYSFVSFRFDPQGQGIQDADVLSRLIEDATTLELVNTQRGGQFRLDYQFEEDAFGDRVNGDFSVTSQTVTLAVEEADTGLLGELLLGDRVVFRRTSSDVLTLSETRVVDLVAYDPSQYGGSGLTNVRGTLEIELRRLGR